MMAWGTIIAWYLFLAGVSAGAYLTSSYVARKYPKLTIIRNSGRYLAPVLMAVGLLLLIFDAEAGLHHPLRFMYLFTNFNSMMTIGTYFISIFMIVALYTGVMEYLKKDTPKWVEYTGMVFAVGTAIYTGFLIGVVSTVPLWNTAILPILFVVSAGSTGAAATLLGASFFDAKGVHEVISLKKLHLGFMVTELFLIFTMFYITASNSAVAAESIGSMVSGEFSLLFWLGLITVGLLFPIVVESLELFNHSKQTHSPDALKVAATGQASVLSTVVTESTVLAGGFILRFLILAAALPIAFL